MRVVFLLLGLVAFCGGLTAAGTELCVLHDQDDSWSWEIAQGVVDYATVGVKPNLSYFCFDGCLITNTLVANFNVDLASNLSSQRISRTDAIADRMAAQAARMDSMPPASGDDPDLCINKTLLHEVKQAIKKSSTTTAQAIAQAILLNVNKPPGWLIMVAEYTGGSDIISTIFSDDNFCEFDNYVGEKFYNVKMAKIKTTESTKH